MTVFLTYLLALAIFAPALLVLAILMQAKRNERLTVEISRTIIVATTQDRPSDAAA